MTSTTSQATVVEPAEPPLKRKLFPFILNPDISSYFIAGGVAGAASRTVVSPLERLKIIQSVFFRIPKSSELHSFSDKYNRGPGR